MKQRVPSSSKSRQSKSSKSRHSHGRWIIVAVLGCSILVGVLASFRPQHPTLSVGRTQPVETDDGRPLTFHRDIAPIIFQRCAPCHHPGGAGPFSLVTYADIHKRARQIGEVLQKGLMPPWLPEHGEFPLAGDRSLAPVELARIQRWLGEGSPEGASSEAPATPKWAQGWSLGTPDLVVTLTNEYRLSASGPDVYRNFVLPIQNAERRYVRAIELKPAEGQAVHHAFLLLDPTRDSRRRDDADPLPGFDGLHTPRTAQSPEGHFLSWQPGKQPGAEAGGLAWPLEKDSDLVVQTHLRPTGRAETIRPTVAFYFTNQPPARLPFKLGMRSFTLDIPAGATAHWVQDSLTIPVDVDLVSILPHAHYLAVELQAVARFPDGREHSLLRIPRWDFNWQGDYTYQTPVFLPRGTVVSMRYRYDNSTNNPVNPHSPPERVRYGLQSTDEMAELWLQVLPRRADDVNVLTDAYRPRLLEETVLYNQYLLARNPKEARAYSDLGKVHLARNQVTEAIERFQKAVQLAPEDDEPYYFLGVAQRVHQDLAAAKAAFERSIQLNPRQAKAFGNLGLIAAEMGDAAAAANYFREALRLNPDDLIAQEGLKSLGLPKG